MSKKQPGERLGIAINHRGERCEYLRGHGRVPGKICRRIYGRFELRGGFGSRHILHMHRRSGPLRMRVTEVVLEKARSIGQPDVMRKAVETHQALVDAAFGAWWAR